MSLTVQFNELLIQGSFIADPHCTGLCSTLGLPYDKIMRCLPLMTRTTMMIIIVIVIGWSSNVSSLSSSIVYWPSSQWKEAIGIRGPIPSPPTNLCSLSYQPLTTPSSLSSSSCMFTPVDNSPAALVSAIQHAHDSHDRCAFPRVHITEVGYVDMQYRIRPSACLMVESIGT
jgi:hypothetical protein